MDSPHFLGNFKSPAPLRANAIGAPKQIAHYSCFPGATNEYGYQSREALKLFRPPCVPFSFIKAIDKPTFYKMSDYLDSLPQQGLEPVITSCQQAGSAVDLLEANVITRRGVMSNLSLGIKCVYDVSFVEGKLHILRQDFQIRTEIPHSGPYYGHCFEELCTHSITEKPHGIFFSVVRRKFDDLNIIMAGEVDCSSRINVEPGLKDYIELKTAKKTDRWSPPNRYAELFPKWYMQSYLLGVPALAIGYRNFKNHVFTIKRKPIEEVLLDARKCVPGFDPAVNLGRAHAILSALLEHFRSLGKSVSAQDRFELHIDANGDAWVTSPTNSSSLAG